MLFFGTSLALCRGNHRGEEDFMKAIVISTAVLLTVSIFIPDNAFAINWSQVAQNLRDQTMDAPGLSELRSELSSRDKEKLNALVIKIQKEKDRQAMREALRNDVKNYRKEAKQYYTDNLQAQWDAEEAGDAQWVLVDNFKDGEKKVPLDRILNRMKVEMPTQVDMSDEFTIFLEDNLPCLASQTCLDITAQSRSSFYQNKFLKLRNGKPITKPGESYFVIFYTAFELGASSAQDRYITGQIRIPEEFTEELENAKKQQPSHKNMRISFDEGGSAILTLEPRVSARNQYFIDHHLDKILKAREGDTETE